MQFLRKHIACPLKMRTPPKIHTYPDAAQQAYISILEIEPCPTLTSQFVRSDYTGRPPQTQNKMMCGKVSNFNSFIHFSSGVSE